MGAWGAIIMSFFAALFAAMTLRLQWHAGVTATTPFVGFAIVAALAALVLRQPGPGVVPSARGARAILWSSIGEGIGLFFAANIVINLHRPDLLLPAMAAVVGLHFLPIGWFAPFTPFLALGAALIVAAGLGALASPSIAGFGAALGLLIASLTALLRDWHARTG